jgi:histidine triad (HIT) family protein
MDCVFCKIVEKKIPSTVVYEDDTVLAFRDINPAAPLHVLVVPKKHIVSVRDLSPEDSPLIGHMFSVMKEIAKAQGVEKDGYRIVTNTGDRAGQSVKHLHFHLLGGRDFAWPPG